MSRPVVAVNYVNPNMTTVKGHGTREMLMTLRPGGRPPAWSAVSKAWTTTPETAADLIALAESRGLTVVITEGDPLPDHEAALRAVPVPMPAPVPALTHTEAVDLGRHEEAIEHGIQTFVAVGEALATIRDQRLYRANYGTFAGYATERWGITDRRARQMIDAASTVTALETGTIVPVSESQARELAGLDPATAAGVMRQADEATSGQVTAAAIRAARPAASPPTATVKPRRRLPLPDAYRKITHDLDRTIERLQKLHEDDHFVRTRVDLRPGGSRSVDAMAKTLARLAGDLQ